MFNISKKVDYALAILIYLAKNKTGPISLRQIAKSEKLPFKYLEQVAMPLRQAGLIKAKEGRSGGYFLAKNPAKVSVSEVVEVIEGPVEVGGCLACPHAAMCGQKDVWSEVGDNVKKTIKNKTLKDLI